MRVWTIAPSCRCRFVMAALATLLATGAAGCAGHGRPAQPPSRPPVLRGEQAFTATAYCQGTKTADGTKVRQGIVAADPAVLPLGSVIRVRGLPDGFDGVYTVRDTGSKVRGRQIDLYMNNCREAVSFGRRRARVTLVQKTSS